MNENVRKFYFKIRKILNKFKEKEYFDTFKEYNMFAVWFMEIPIYISLRYDELSKRYGIETFINQEQQEYFFDMINSNNLNIPPYGAESYLRLELADKSSLDHYELIYLNLEVQTKILSEGNLIPYSYEAGYDRDMASGFEFGALYEALNIIDKELDKDFTHIYELFEKNESVNFFVSVPSFRCKYITAGELYPLFINRRCHNYNKAIVKEFINEEKIDDTCYVVARYLPIINKDTGIRPLLIIFIYEHKKKYITKYIKDSKEEYPDIFMGMLYDLISEEGLPNKFFFDFRDFYYASITTLKRLGVKSVLNTLEDFTTDHFEDALSEIFSMINSEYIEEDEMYNLLIQGASMLTSKLLDELKKGNILLNSNENEEEDNDDINKLDDNLTQ